jgi:hypothetical protein
MSPVLSLLNEMRGRLGMYVGSSSITLLAAFLRGYDYAVYKIGGGTFDPFLPEFREWVYQHFQSNQYTWEETILLHSENETDAVKLFWELLDEFVKEHPQTAATTEPPDANGIGYSARGSRVGES